MLYAWHLFGFCFLISCFYFFYSSRCRDDHIEMYESFDTSGYHLGKHCGSYSEYRIMTITPFAYLHYHTGASSSTSGLKGFRARVEAFDIDECRWPDSCTNACNNIPGSFECSCPDGYFLSSNGKVCFGKFVIETLHSSSVMYHLIVCYYITHDSNCIPNSVPIRHQ